MEAPWGGQENRVVVLGLIGSSHAHGRALLSELLDVDFDFLELKQHEETPQHVKCWSLVEGIAEAYLDVLRSILYIHIPLDTFADTLPTAHQAVTVRTHRTESSESQMHALLVAFAVSHFVLVLHHDTHLDLQLLGKLRSLQVLKNSLFPIVKHKLPLDPKSTIFQVNHDLMRWRKVMLPGYCEPQMVFLYQDAQGIYPSISKELTIQLSELLDKCNVLSKSEACPLFNTHSRVRAMVLPKLSVGFEEEVEDWCSYLNPNMQVELSEHEGMKALKTLVHKRRDHMRSMLKCGSYDVFPTVGNVTDVWKTSYTILDQSAERFRCSPFPEYPSGKYPEVPEAVEAEANEEEMIVGMSRALAWLSFSSNPVYQMSKILCQKAMKAGIETYMNCVPDLYSRAVHESALRSASKKYKSQARGPAIKEFLDKMQSECTSEWHSGRQQCEARSLTGKPCIKGLRTTDEGGAGVVAPCLHRSKPDIKQASASGMTVRRRPDPFSFLDANITFYAECTSDELATCTALPPARGPIQGRKGPKGKGNVKSKPTTSQSTPLLCPVVMDVPMLVWLWDNGQLPQDKELQRAEIRKEHPTKPAVEASDRILASTIVHGWSSLHRLGNASAYNPAEGLQQEGFLQGKNLLHLVDVKTMGNAEPSTSTSADALATHFPPLSGPTTTPSLEHLGARLTAESLANKLEREAAINQWVKARSTESGGSSSKQSQTPRVMSDTPIASRRPKKGKRGTRGRGPGFKEGRGRQQKAWDTLREGTEGCAHHIYFGLEYESTEGHRFIASVNDVSEGAASGSGVLSLFGRMIPLFTKLSVVERKGQSSEGGLHQSGLHCQLQRIFIVTPEPPLLFALRPRITFHCPQDALTFSGSRDAQSEPGNAVKFDYIVGEELILPPNSMCVVKLPFVYGAPSDWFGLSGFEGRLDCTSDKVKDWVPILQREKSSTIVAEVDGSSLLYPL